MAQEILMANGFGSLPELKQASELVAEEGDAATWYVTPLADGRFLAWESVSGWHEYADTAADARAMIDYQWQEMKEAR